MYLNAISVTDSLILMKKIIFCALERGLHDLGASCIHIVQQQFAINSETGKYHVRNVSPASNFPLSDGTKNKRTVNKI